MCEEKSIKFITLNSLEKSQMHFPHPKYCRYRACCHPAAPGNLGPLGVAHPHATHRNYKDKNRLLETPRPDIPLELPWPLTEEMPRRAKSAPHSILPQLPIPAMVSQRRSKAEDGRELLEFGEGLVKDLSTYNPAFRSCCLPKRAGRFCDGVASFRPLTFTAFSVRPPWTLAPFPRRLKRYRGEGDLILVTSLRR